MFFWNSLAFSMQSQLQLKKKNKQKKTVERRPRTKELSWLSWNIMSKAVGTYSALEILPLSTHSVLNYLTLSKINLTRNGLGINVSISSVVMFTPFICCHGLMTWIKNSPFWIFSEIQSQNQISVFISFTFSNLRLWNVPIDIYL